MQVVGVIFGRSDANCTGITALTLTNRFDKMLIIAIISAVTASLLGVLLSYHFDASTGACIILLQAVFFLIALVYSKIKVRLILNKKANISVSFFINHCVLIISVLHNALYAGTYQIIEFE